MSPMRTLPLLLACLFVAHADAADVPRRKSGLWEMKTQMAGIPRKVRSRCASIRPAIM
jgi:hypothetical protein